MSFITPLSPALFSELLYILIRFIWQHKRLFLVITLVFSVVGAVFGGGIWIAAPLAGMTGIRWNLLVAFGAGYVIEYLLTIIEWGARNFDRDGQLDIEQDTMQLSDAVLALHGLISFVLVLVAISVPEIYVPVSATAFGFVLSNLVISIAVSHR